jgi:N-acetyl-gamma-glutamyl-phosphate reductase
MVRVGIIGALGYAGQELVRLLLRHPSVEIVEMADQVETEVPIGELLPAFRKRTTLSIRPVDVERVKQAVETVFLALPHKVSQGYVSEFCGVGKRVIDLSADFRFEDAERYEKVYETRHLHRDLLKSAVYGLPEVNRERIRSAEIIAVPGCYPTSVLLALAPIIRAEWVDARMIVADSKSGVSGAGRTPSGATHFPECNESMKAYSVAVHRHGPEIEEKLSQWAERTVHITFVPHLVPMNRGILSTVYAGLKKHVMVAEVKEIYERYYREEPFVRLCPAGRYPETKDVVGTNFCDLAWKVDEATHRLIIISAIDNLVKGAAGQAVQCFNIAHDFPETEGLL